MGIGITLKNLIEQQNTNVNELASKTGISPSTIYSIIKRDNLKVDFDVLLTLSEELNVNIDYFYSKRPALADLTSEAKQLIKKYSNLDQYGKELVDTIIDIELKRISDMNLSSKEYLNSCDDAVSLSVSCQRAAAGSGVFLEDEEMYQINVVFNHLTARADFCVPVDGNSMLPKYKDGDILLVHKQPDVEIGEIGIFALDGKGYVKKRGLNKLISLNKDYEDIAIQEGKIATCNGKVIGILDPEWVIN